MTDKERLIAYRFNQAQETLDDAEKIYQAGGSTRSVVNRAYYAAFYSVLGLFLKADINPKTSKRKGIITLFDRQFTHPGRIDKQYSETAPPTFFPLM